MGMREPFTSEADFSGIVGKRGELKVDRVIHEATIEVSEEGTEAAAATAAVEDRPVSEQISRPIVFRADRPFLYAVVDNGTQNVLFWGRFVIP
jgi:serpin B